MKTQTKIFCITRVLVFSSLAQTAFRIRPKELTTKDRKPAR